MPTENLYICPISKKIFFDPVYPLCRSGKENSVGHVFEKEALLDSLKENPNCPVCHTRIESEKHIQTANDIKENVTKAIQEKSLLACNQYLPRDVIFSLFNEKNPDIPLAQIEEILKHQHKELQQKQSIGSLSYIFLDNITTKKQKLILYALKTQPQLMAYFLWQSIQTSQLKVIVKKLININDAFNEITINQFISHTMANQQKINSVSYLLLYNIEGRESLKENKTLCTLMGEKLSEDSLKQFLNQATHEGTLYYLLIDEEVGQEILKSHTCLQKKISKIGETVLSKQINDGPYKGQSLQDLHNQVFNLSALSRNLMR